MHRHEIVPEMAAGAAPEEKIPAEHHAVAPMVRNNELDGQSDRYPVVPMRAEMHAEPYRSELDSRHVAQELHSKEIEGGSAVSPISNDQHDLMRRNTYDDPQLMQNPWAHDDPQVGRG